MNEQDFQAAKTAWRLAKEANPGATMRELLEVVRPGNPYNDFDATLLDNYVPTPTTERDG
jgi:hypothetical protein